MIWSSPVQPSSIKLLVTLPQVHLAFTVDLEGTVKVWNCQDEDALAALTMPQACFSLEAFLTKDGPFLMVSDPCMWRGPTKQNAWCLDRCCGPLTVTSHHSLSSWSHLYDTPWIMYRWVKIYRWMWPYKPLCYPDLLSTSGTFPHLFLKRKWKTSSWIISHLSSVYYCTVHDLGQCLWRERCGCGETLRKKCSVDVLLSNYLGEECFGA